jgi:hypothetical protein
MSTLLRTSVVQTETIMGVHSDEHSRARLASCFGGRQLITRKVAASILGVDIKTLTAMRETHVIPGISTASCEFRFSEADLRAYLSTARSGQD